MFLKGKKLYCISIILTIILISVSLIQSFAVKAEPTSSISSQSGEMVAKTNYSPVSNFQAPAPGQYSTGADYIDCYIAPDLSSKEQLVLQGFQIDVVYKEALVNQGKTNENGYLKLNWTDVIPQSVFISKAGFLTKTINITASQNLGSAKEPLLMWAGDMNQDKAINMKDIIEIAKSFNSIPGDTRYNATADFNADKAINMIDILIVSKHFNKASTDYPPTNPEIDAIVHLTIAGSDDINVTGGGWVSISPASKEGIDTLRPGSSAILTFTEDTQVTFTANIWGNADFSYTINDDNKTRVANPLILTVQGGERISYFINAKYPTPTPIYTPTPTQDISTPTPTSIYPKFCRMPYDVSTKMVADSITKDSANISADIMTTHYARVSSSGTLVYWKKNNPEDKVSINISIVPEATFEPIPYSVNSQITGLDADTAYCYQLNTYISPNGEMQTGPYDYYWTYGNPEAYNSSVYEFNTLPQ